MRANSFKVAAVQFEPTQFKHKENIKKLYSLVEEAAKNGAKLIVTPEMGTTGYCFYSREEVAPYVEPIPGNTTAIFEKLAMEYQCYIVIGMPEVDPENNLYYNSAALIGPEGFVGKHRKTHPYIAETKWAVNGELGHQVFETSIGRIAILICMDMHYIETSRIQALSGADVICHISNWLDERTPAPYWINRAFENNCYVIESNRWGWERTVKFSGGSCVIDPEGQIQAVIDNGDAVAYAEIDLEKARNKNVNGRNLIKHRRPEMYRELMTNSYTWNPLDLFGLYGHEPFPPGQKSTIAVGQFMPGSSKSNNFAKIEEQTKEAKQNGAELIVFPELSISGMFQDESSAEPVPGKSTDQLVKMSLKYRMYIVAGLVEADNGLLFNTAVLTGPEGFIGKYRKIHLNESERTWARAGDEWKTFDLKIGRVGLLIGYDTLIPEAGRLLALRGCDMLLCPSLLNSPVPTSHPGTKVPQNYPIPTGADPLHWHLHRVRAGENNVYLAFANADDSEKGFYGKSGIFGPETFKFPRNESVVMEEEGLAYVEVDTSNTDTMYPTNVVKRKDLMLMRQPHFYKDLVSTELTSEGLIERKVLLPQKG
ncbi:nitrilase-related carbon-nitrogen hydrolase [Cytobacillus firmus]|uniref:nitrilase-related carbon-nitrogen hydrolase n=1 Tax=Cytobacillus firmus TaxID=1399 RepID=UPI0018CF1963|nr:nitrilase-related carbon-nitrogen hydrolase [Cytobacillus firmus]MBG9445303.1 amidohydrolase [Cytobacillus firmus]MCS0654803.1 amidohydrolase [Cytobacillus firmus]